MSAGETHRTSRKGLTPVANANLKPWPTRTETAFYTNLRPDEAA